MNAQADEANSVAAFHPTPKSMVVTSGSEIYDRKNASSPYKGPGLDCEKTDISLSTPSYPPEQRPNVCESHRRSALPSNTKSIILNFLRGRVRDSRSPYTWNSFEDLYHPLYPDKLLDPGRPRWCSVAVIFDSEVGCSKIR